MDNRQIGRFIAECRKEKGLTQRELGERLHVTDRAVSKWETGKSFPDVSILEDVCRELDISVSELLAGKRIAAEHYKEETEKVLIASIGQRQLMGFEVVCSVLKLLFIFLIMFPSVVNDTFLPKLNLITIFSWSMAAILGGCMSYMDRNLPERNFRKSNPVMQGVLMVVTFGIYLLANVFRPANNMFSGATMGEKIKLTIIILIIAFCLFVFAAVVAKIHREEWEWQKEKEAENRSE